MHIYTFTLKQRAAHFFNGVIKCWC